MKNKVSNPWFREEKVKPAEILSGKEIKILELFISGNTKVGSYLTVYPQHTTLSNSQILNVVERLFSLPRCSKFIRERTAKNGE